MESGRLNNLFVSRLLERRTLSKTYAALPFHIPPAPSKHRHLYVYIYSMEGCSGCGGHNRLIFISQLKPFCGMLRFSCIAHFRQHFQAKAVGVVFAVFGVGACFAAMPQSNNDTVMKDVTGDDRSLLEDCLSSCSLLSNVCRR